MDAFSMGLVAAMGALATVAGASEDIESDVGSQSNPNSQVQLAAQVGNPHRIYNKAISGEPPANALWCATAAIVAYAYYRLPDARIDGPGSRRIRCCTIQRCLFNELLLWQELQPGQVQPVGLSGYRQVHHAIDYGACLDNIILYCNYIVYHGIHAANVASLPNAHHRIDLGIGRGRYWLICGRYSLWWRARVPEPSVWLRSEYHALRQYCEESRGRPKKLHRQCLVLHQVRRTGYWNGIRLDGLSG